MLTYSFIKKKDSGILIKSQSYFCSNCEQKLKKDTVTQCPKCKQHLIKKEAKEWFDKGAAAKDIESKIEFYQKAIDLSPNYSYAYNNLAYALYISGDFSQSEELYTTVIHLDPELKVAYYCRGLTRIHLKSYEDAIVDFTKTIELDNQDMLAYFNRALCYGKLKEYENETNDYQYILDTDSKNVKVYNNMGESYLKQELNEKALNCFSKSIELDPDFIPAFINRALIYQSMEDSRFIKDFTEAIKYYSNAIKENPNDHKQYIDRAVLYEKFGQDKNAIQDLLSAKKIDDTKEEIYTKLAILFEKSKMFTEAIESYNDAIKINPEYPVYYINRGNCLNQIKNYDDALKDFNKVFFEYKFQDKELFINRGIAFLNTSEIPKALEDFDKALELDSNNYLSYYYKGLANIKTENYDKASEDIEKAIQIEPNFVDSYIAKALCLESNEKFEDALKMYSKAIEINGKRSDFYYKRAKLNLKQNLLKEAIDDANNGLSIDNKDLDLLLLRSDLLFQDKEYEKSILDMEEILKLQPDNQEIIEKKIEALFLDKKYQNILEDIEKLDSKTREIVRIQIETLLEINEYEKAASIIEEEFKDDSLPENLLKAASIIFQHVNKSEIAVNYTKEYLQCHPEDIEAKFNLAKTMYDLEDYQSALDTIKTLIEKDKKNLEYLEIRKSIFVKLKKYFKALKDINKIIDLTENKNASIYIERANILMNLEHQYEAIEDYIMAFKLDMNSFPILQKSIKLLLNEGKYLRVYDLVDDINQFEHKYKANLSQIQMETVESIEDPSTKHEYLSKMLTKELHVDDKKKLLRNILEIELKDDSKTNILKTIEELLIYEPKDLELLNHKLNILIKNNKNPKALETLLIIDSLKPDKINKVKLIDLYQKNGATEKAIETLNKLEKEDAKLVTPEHLNLKIDNYIQNDPQKALDLIEDLIKNKKAQVYHYEKYLELAQEGYNLSKQITALDWLTDNSKDSLKYKKMRADIFYASKNYKKAYEDLVDIVEKNKKDTESLKILVELSKNLQKDSYEKYLDLLIDQQPKNNQLVEQRFEFNFERKNYRKAASDIEFLQKNKDKDLKFHQKCLEIYQKIENKDLQKQEILKLSQLDPENIEYIGILAGDIGNISDKKIQVNILEKALKANIENLDYTKIYTNIENNRHLTDSIKSKIFDIIIQKNYPNKESWLSKRFYFNFSNRNFDKCNEDASILLETIKDEDFLQKSIAVFDKNKNYDKQLKALEKLKQINPKNIEYLKKDLKLSLSHGKDYSRAADDCLLILKLNDKDATPIYQKQLIQILKDNNAILDKKYREFIPIETIKSVQKTKIENLLKEESGLLKAEKELNVMIKDDPSDIDLLETLLSIYQKLEDSNKQIATLKVMINIDKKINYLEQIFALYKHQKKYTNAYVSLKDIIDLQAPNVQYETLEEASKLAKELGSEEQIDFQISMIKIKKNDFSLKEQLLSLLKQHNKNLKDPKYSLYLPEPEVTKDKTEVTKDKTETTKDKTEITKDKTEVTKDKTEVTKDKTEVTKDKTEITKDKTEITKDKTEITKDKTEITKDKTEITKDKTEVTKDKTEITKDKTSILSDENEIAILYKQNKFKEVISILEGTPKKSMKMLTFLKDSYLKIEDLDLYQETLNLMIVNSPSDYSLRNEMYKFSLSKKDNQQALNDLINMLEYSTKDQFNRNFGILVKFYQKQPENKSDAWNVIQAVINENPKNINLLQQYLELLKNLSDKEQEFVSILRKLIKLDPSNSEKYLFELKDVFIKNNQHTKTLDTMSKLYFINNDNFECIENYFKQCIKESNLPKALTIVNQIIQILPNSDIKYSYILQKAGILFKQKKYDKTINEIKKIIRKYDDATMLYLQGKAYLKLKEYKDCVENFTLYLKSKSNNHRVYFSRGIAYLKLNEPKKALEDFDKTINLSPNFSKAYINRATAYLLIKNPQQAKESLSKILEIEKKESSVFQKAEKMLSTIKIT